MALHCPCAAICQVAPLYEAAVLFAQLPVMEVFRLA